MSSSEQVAVANAAWDELWRVLLQPRVEIFQLPEEPRNEDAAVDAEVDELDDPGVCPA